MDSKRKRESEAPDAAEKNRETKLAKVDSSATKPDVNNYIVSGRFEEDIKRFFPDHEQEVEADAFSHCMDIAAFLAKVKKPEARAALEKFDQLMRQGAIPESELLTHGTYGVDYVANEMLEDKGDWYFLCAAGDDTYVFNPNTGAVHFCNDEGVAPKWTFNDIDSYAYVMLRGSAVLEDALPFTKELRDELLSLNQFCVKLVVETFLEDLLAEEGGAKHGKKPARKNKNDEEDEEDDDDEDDEHQEGEKEEEDDDDEESDEEESEEEETLLKDTGPVTLSKDGPKDYILSGRFEADLKTLFPSYTPKPVVASKGHADVKAFLANLKDKHHKEVFEKFDSILMSGAVPKGLEFFGVGGYGFDYTDMGALDGEEPHMYYFLPNAADGAFVLNAKTGVVHMVDSEEDSVSEDTFNDLDSYAYAMLRVTSAGQRVSAADVSKELESMNQSAATWVAETWISAEDD